jgi:hypothetical protein
MRYFSMLNCGLSCGIHFLWVWFAKYASSRRGASAGTAPCTPLPPGPKPPSHAQALRPITVGFTPCECLKAGLKGYMVK